MLNYELYRQTFEKHFSTEHDEKSKIITCHNSKILTDLNFPPKQKSPFSKNH
jgi:hypothetical protein